MPKEAGIIPIRYAAAYILDSSSAASRLAVAELLHKLTGPEVSDCSTRGEERKREEGREGGE
jgi:hypothetical protein